MANEDNPKIIKIWVQIGVTAILLLFSIYLVSTVDDSSSKLKWAYGIIGIIIGYWLK